MTDLRSQTRKGRLARARILEAGEGLFVTHGFHGTSVRDIAKAARVPLATLVYHFAKKEQLYGALLGTIGEELDHELDGVEGPAQLAATLVRWHTCNPRRVVLLLRELLDNPARVVRATHLPLAPFLRKATAIAATAPAVTNAELCVLHLVGGISYVIAAQPTVDRIAGRRGGGYEHDALVFAHRVLGLPSPRTPEPPHAPRPASPARSPRARSRRAAHDR